MLRNMPAVKVARQLVPRKSSSSHLEPPVADLTTLEIGLSASKVMVSEWVEGRSLATAGGLSETERNEIGLRYVRFLFAGPSRVGLLHALSHGAAGARGRAI